MATLSTEEKWMLAAIVALVVFTRKRVEWQRVEWQWPVPRIRVNGRTYTPVITDGWGSPRPGGRVHTGVDIVFPRLSVTDLVREYPPGSSNGGRLWFAPPHTPIVAAAPGTIYEAGTSERGKYVVLSHGKDKGFATFYQHLETLAVEDHEHGKNKRTGLSTPVNAGAVLGFMGFDPSEGSHVRHLHFEVWYEGDASDAVDPAPSMKQWPLAPQIYTV